MLAFVRKTVVRNILPFFRRVLEGRYDMNDAPSDQPFETSPDETPGEGKPVDPISHFGEAISDAEYLISRRMYREALVIYRKLNSDLVGRDELMKIQYVREKIEMLLNRISQEPTNLESAQIIEEEKKSAEERYHATVLEADNYFEHELYNESLFLYLKLQREWAGSKDLEKISLIREKVAFLNEVVDDAFKISARPIDPDPVSDLTVPEETSDLARLFGERISDAEHLIARRQYREALGIYRQLNSDLTGSGELMKIQFVRDKIESLFNRINQEPPTPESADIIAREKKSAEERFNSTLLEADNYFQHGLYDEAMFLYRKLEKEWAGSKDSKKITLINEKVVSCQEYVQDSSDPVDANPIVYLDQDGAITEEPPEILEPEPLFPGRTGKWFVAFLNQRAVLIAVHVLVVAAGIYCLFTSPFERTPPVKHGAVYITTHYDGAGVDDVETLVTAPIEKSIQSMDSIASITSTSYRNRSAIAVKFEDGSNVTERFSHLKRQVLSIRDTLPVACGDPTFLFVDTNDNSTVMQINLSGGSSELNRQIMAEKLKTVLLSIEGIQDVDMTGKTKNEVRVSLSPEKLNQQGVTFFDVTQALISAGSTTLSGPFAVRFVPETAVRFSRESDVLDVVVRKGGPGEVIRVADVVTSARLSPLEPRALASVRGEEAIGLIVRKDNRANAISLARKVRKASDGFFKLHEDEGLSMTYTDDSTQETIGSIRIFIWNLVIGIFLMAVIFRMTLGAKNAMLAVFMFPFFMLATLVAKMILGIPVYIINLFIFVLMSGIAVDNIVVLIENIDRHRKMGKSLRCSVIEGVAEIFWPMVVILITLAMALVPMFFITGPTGSFFVMIPLALMFGLFASSVGSLFFLPAYMLQRGSVQAGSMGNGPLMAPEVPSRIWPVYERILDGLLRRKRRTMTLIGLLLVAAIGIAGVSLSGLAPVINVTFFPENNARCQVHVVLPSSTSIGQTDHVIRDLSKCILSLGQKQVLSMSGTSGYSVDEDGRILEGPQYGRIVVDVPERDPEKHMADIRAKLHAYLDETYPVPDRRPQVMVFPESTGHAPQQTLGVRISGQNLDQALEASHRIMGFLKNGKETQDLSFIGDDRAPHVTVTNYPLNPDMAHDLRLRDRITHILAGLSRGVLVGKFQTASDEIDLKVMLDRPSESEKAMETESDLPPGMDDIPVMDRGIDSPLVFSDVVSAVHSMDPDFKNRFNGLPTVTISAVRKAGANLSSERFQTLVSGFFETISKDHPGVTLGFSGQSQSSGNNFNAFFIGLFIAFFLIYLIYALYFGDYLQPLIIFTTIAFALIGVTLGMLLFRSTFTAGSLMSMVGIAIVTMSNTMVLMVFIHNGVNAGNTIRDAIKDACRLRLRPVLLTTLTVMAGLLPMALGIPFESREWAPMALAFVTGLGFSTLLTLFVVPVEYEIVAAIKHLFKHDPL